MLGIFALERCTALFTKSTSIILLFSAGAKLIGFLRVGLAPYSTDPVLFFLTHNQVLFAACLFELTVALAALFYPSRVVQLYAINWLSIVLLSYRLGLRLTASSFMSCSCLGDAYLWLRIAPEQLDILMLLLLAYMAIASGTLLLAMLSKDSERKPAVRNFRLTVVQVAGLRRLKTNWFSQ